MVRITLNPEQQILHDNIEKYLQELKADLKQKSLSYDKQMEIFKKMANDAHQLHMSLNPKPKHHGYMIQNRGVQPEEPEFYFHIHPVEDLLKYIEDTDANNDPIDQTIGNEFKLKVYSKRWGHADEYSLKRIENGWFFSFSSYVGECTKDGKPYIYAALNHESISYPNDLPGFLEWLWEQAKLQGLTYTEVQNALNQISDWIYSCEVNTPRGIFRGYK